jgi:hypothetical protein
MASRSASTPATGYRPPFNAARPAVSDWLGIRLRSSEGQFPENGTAYGSSLVPLSRLLLASLSAFRAFRGDVVLPQYQMVFSLSACPYFACGFASPARWSSVLRSTLYREERSTGEL